MSQVVKFAQKLKLDTNKLLGDWIVCIPGFTLQKYRQLQESQLSIFSIDCFGGILSNTLGLPFRSPFVNLYLNADEYLRFLRSPRVYMEEKVIYRESKWNDMLKINFPVCTLGNISLVMNHYPNFDEAVKIWNKRKQRINWYNIFVVMSATSLETLEQFNELPYGKKFVLYLLNLI